MLLLNPALSVDTLMHAAFAESADVAGKYVSNARAAQAHSATRDALARSRLWRHSCDMAAIRDPLPFQVRGCTVQSAARAAVRF